MDLTLNNLQRLICHKTKPTNQPIKPMYFRWKYLPLNNSKSYALNYMYYMVSIKTCLHLVGILAIKQH